MTAEGLHLGQVLRIIDRSPTRLVLSDGESEHVLAPMLAVKGATMGAAIAAMLVVEAAVTWGAQPVPTVGFALISVVSLALAWRVVRSLAPGSVDLSASAGPAPRLPGAPITQAG